MRRLALLAAGAVVGAVVTIAFAAWSVLGVMSQDLDPWADEPDA